MGGGDVCDKKIVFLSTAPSKKGLVVEHIFTRPKYRRCCISRDSQEAGQGDEPQSSRLQGRSGQINVIVTVSADQQVPRKTLGGHVARPPKAAGIDKVNLFLVSRKQGRCLVCSKNTRLMCEKCEARLHKNICFEQFHS